MKPIFLLFLLLPLTQARAQDFHFSDYTNATLQLNPALTGFIPGGAPSRAQATYRDQWNTPLGTGAFRTAAASYDHRYCGNFREGYGSFGLSVFTNLRGENTLQTSGFLASGAYTRKLAGTNRYPTLITLAFEAGITQNALVPRNRTFDVQFDDPDAPGELFLTGSSLTPDVGVGLFISKSVVKRAQQSRFKPDTYNAGIAIKHVNRPIFKFLDSGQAETTRLPIRFNAHVSATKGFTKRSVNVLAIYTYQQPFSMLYARALMTFRTNQPTRYAVGLGLRVNNDVNGINSKTAVVTGQYRKDKVNLSLSYDINFGSIKNATSGNGAFEISAGWYFGSESCVNCPVSF